MMDMLVHIGAFFDMIAELPDAASAMQHAYDRQRLQDLYRIVLEGDRRPTRVFIAGPEPAEPIVLVRRQPCPHCNFWRDRYDQAGDQIDDLRAQMKDHGLRPADRLDGHESGNRRSA